MTQYHVKIWATVEYGMGLATGSAYPTNIPSRESVIEAHTLEATMKRAMLATNFKRVALIIVNATDGHEFQAFSNAQKDNEGSITHADAKETTPEYRVPGIFMKSDLN
jgi:hypothetical protein